MIMDVYEKGLKYNRCIKVYPEVMRYSGISIYQWDVYQNHFCMGKYVVLCNLELATMQGVAPKDTFPVCVMDDFGNLVRVKP
jgi:hypothetical protein